MLTFCDSLSVMSCRGQIGKQVVEHLSVENVRDLAAFQAKELINQFGAATGDFGFRLSHLCTSG